MCPGDFERQLELKCAITECLVRRWYWSEDAGHWGCNLERCTPFQLLLFLSASWTPWLSRFPMHQTLYQLEMQPWDKINLLPLICGCQVLCLSDYRWLRQRATWDAVELADGWVLGSWAREGSLSPRSGCARGPGFWGWFCCYLLWTYLSPIHTVDLTSVAGM